MKVNFLFLWHSENCKGSIVLDIDCGVSLKDALIKGTRCATISHGTPPEEVRMEIIL